MEEHPAEEVKKVGGNAALAARLAETGLTEAALAEAINIVHPELQNLGIGRRIHEKLLSQRLEQRVTIATHHGNTHARMAYLRWGYEHVGTRQLEPPTPLLDVFTRSLHPEKSPP